MYMPYIDNKTIVIFFKMPSGHPVILFVSCKRSCFDEKYSCRACRVVDLRWHAGHCTSVCGSIPMMSEFTAPFLLLSRPYSGIMVNPTGESESTMLPTIDYSLCTGCGACAQLYPQFFEIRDDKAWFINHEKFDMALCKGIVGCCPFGAIAIE